MRHTLLPSIVITLFAVVTLHGEPPPLPAPHVRIADPAQIDRLALQLDAADARQYQQIVDQQDHELHASAHALQILASRVA